MKKKDIKFCKNLHKLRCEKKLSQVELAEMTEISDVSISGYERGVRLPTLNALVNIAEALGVSLDELVFGSIRSKN